MTDTLAAWEANYAKELDFNPGNYSFEGQACKRILKLISVVRRQNRTLVRVRDIAQYRVDTDTAKLYDKDILASTNDCLVEAERMLKE